MSISMFYFIHFPLKDTGDRCVQDRLGCSLGLWIQRTQSWEESQLHINMLELRAIYLACWAFLPFIEGITIQILMDNTTVMLYINNRDDLACPYLCHKVIYLWDWCILQLLNLVALHLPGTKNNLVNYLAEKALTITNWIRYSKRVCLWVNCSLPTWIWNIQCFAPWRT